MLPLLIIGALAACTASGGSSPEDDFESEALISRPPFDRMPPLPSGAGTPLGTAEVPDEVWAAIVDDLAGRVDRDLDPAAVEVLGAEQVTWNDGSLGCPQPGQMYTQALVDGYRVVVSFDGEEYDYRTGGSSVMLCTSGVRPER